MNQFEQPQIDLSRFRPYIFGGIIALIVLIIVSKTIVILQPTERGVIFYKWGSGLDVENTYSEGLNFVAPWNDMIRFDISEQKLEETMDVLSSDGLAIQVDVSIRYNPVPEKVGYLFKSFKMNYTDNLVRQELRSAVRKIIGRYTPEELYSTKREEIESSIRQATLEILEENYVELQALLIRSVRLPQAIMNAIESKLKEEQEQLAYQFRLEKEKSEAERKRIAAEGEAKANSIINSSLTPNLLKMRGIEATKEVSKSPNAKVIIIGGGDDGMPLILNSN
jgi:regulator of protease activity HflC (stomatin/prohibitin superfamily)